MKLDSLPTDFVSLFGKSRTGLSLRDFLEHCPCDVIVDVDVEKDAYARVFISEQKFVIPSSSFLYSNLCRHMAAHIVHPDDLQKMREFMEPSTLLERLDKAQGNCLAALFRFRLRDGGFHYVNQVAISGKANGMPKGIVRFYGIDVHSRIMRELGSHSLVDLGRRDHLTGLYSDRDFVSYAASVVSANPNPDWQIAVLDIDNFRLFNDWFGHEKGDELLRKVGAIIASSAERVRGVGGYFLQDDFALLLPENEKELHRIHGEIHSAVAELGAPIGFLPAIGVCPLVDAKDIDDALDKASVACDKAKESLSERLVLYSHDIHQTEEREYRVIIDFLRALKMGEITFFLQPQVRLSNGKVVGCEALARWVRPNGSVVPPMEFIPALEKHGFISLLDQYIWDRVFHTLKEWIDQGNFPIPVSVNLSRADIFAIDVPAYFRKLFDKYKVPPELVKVEITESAYSENEEFIERLVDEFHKMRVKVYMDDFGAGYSSLNMLGTIKVDAVKLDAAFLRMKGDEYERSLPVLESVVAMTKTLGLLTIIEGVETKEQRDFLESLGCRYAQGFFYSKPIPLTDFHNLISDEKNIDKRGFTVKLNEQFRLREFLDQNVYSDSMLNSILGPVAIYSLHRNGQVDIVRYNQQFYEAVNVPDFEERIENIGRFVLPSRREAMINALKSAAKDRLNGAKVLIPTYRTDGTLAMFSMHFFYVGKKQGTQRFYGSADDITTLHDLRGKMDWIGKVGQDTIVFAKRVNGKLVFETAVNGLESILGVDGETLAKELGEQVFSERHIPDEKMREITCDAIRKAIGKKESILLPLSFRAPNGLTFKAAMSLQCIASEESNLEYLLLLRRAQ